MRALGSALTLTAVAVITVSTPAWAQPATPKIAFIDIQRVAARSAAGVAAREQLEREKAVMQKEVDAKLQELKGLREELEKKGPLMTAEARREKGELLERKQRDASRLMDDLQKELAKKEQTASQRVLREIEGVVTRIAKERGYTAIFDGRLLLYASPEADLTDEIIRAYDQQNVGKDKK